MSSVAGYDGRPVTKRPRYLTGVQDHFRTRISGPQAPEWSWTPVKITGGRFVTGPSIVSATLLILAAPDAQRPCNPTRCSCRSSP